MHTDNLEIIIPARNEEATIADVMRGIKEALGNSCRVIVVDDASSDQTAEIAKAHGAAVIRHPYRMGNGASIKTGLRNATAEIVALMDADLQHSPRDIPRLLEYSATFDMVIAARDFSKPTPRNLANRVYNAFASYVSLFHIQDLTCGFRIIKRREALKFLYLLPNSFSSPSTLTLAFLKTGRALKYVSIPSIRRKAGKSKINLFQDGIRFFMIILRVAIFFSPLRVFLPISAAFFAIGLAYYVYTFAQSHRFTNMSALLFTTSLIIFMLGLISEQIAQLRMDKTEETRS